MAQRVAVISGAGVDPEVTGFEASLMHADALATRLVLAFGSFDVVAGSNLFGNLLSEIAAATTGAIGIAPSANLDPERHHLSLFEPTHGSPRTSPVKAWLTRWA